VSVHNTGQLCIECHDPHDPYLVWKDFYKQTAHVSASEIFTSTCAKCHSNISKIEAFSTEEEEWKKQVAKMNELFDLGLSNEQQYVVSSYIVDEIKGEE
jgi:nitrate/TMAO reductase-like tetraheme cytochrome c subunit